ncbi:MAG: LysM peptidoglycan-binding domain-containing protein [Lachnospiraceae bacterium]|nr:LysM peptidoglycan-binding domain-containing protein [Lachnospiraceae bacterium]
MTTGASERRIRNNKIRRRREMRRNIFMCLLTIMLVISLSLTFFAFGTKAQSNDEEILYKYYKSITVQDGDTLWDYAEQYGSSEHYADNQAYIDEVIKMNALTDDEITSGQHIILPYYSLEFVG